MDHSPARSFGCKSFEHFTLPLGEKTLRISVQKPHEMTEDLGRIVATTVACEQDQIRQVVGNGEYQDQSHIQPELNISLPGTYLVQVSSMGALKNASLDTVRLTMNYGSTHRCQEAKADGDLAAQIRSMLLAVLTSSQPRD